MTEATQTVKTAETLELQRLIRELDTLEGRLRQQRQLLQRRGMSLPPGTLTSVGEAKEELEKLLQQYVDTYREVERLRALGRIAELINSNLNLDDVLNDVIDSVIRLTRAERGYILLRNAESGELEFKVARNLEHRDMVRAEIIISNTIVKKVAETGTPLLTMDAGLDEAIDPSASIISQQLRSIVCVPLMLRDEVTGVVYADNRVRPGMFTEKELQLLQTFTNQAAVAIQNARLFEQLRARLTEITAMRDLLNNVFKSIASGVITTDTEDRITILNPAAQRILNLPEQDDCIGRLLPEVWDFIHADTLSEIRQNDLYESVEIETEIPGRGLVTLNIQLSPLRNSANAIEGVAIVVDDLTALKQRENQLNAVRRYLTPSMVDNIRSIESLALGGERRVVTAMFIDVRSFKSFPPTLSPQEVMTYLNRHLTIAADGVTQRNGIIDKYIANELMGLFNTQLNPMEDHAVRAVLAAIDLAEDFHRLYEQLGEPRNSRHYRMGIHTGVATLGNVGSETRRDFTAIGDSINLSHRLLENAKNGEIVISEEVYRQAAPSLAHLGRRLQVSPLEQIIVKNRREPVYIHRLSLED